MTTVTSVVQTSQAQGMSIEINMNTCICLWTKGTYPFMSKENMERSLCWTLAGHKPRVVVRRFPSETIKYELITPNYATLTITTRKLHIFFARRGNFVNSCPFTTSSAYCIAFIQFIQPPVTVRHIKTGQNRNRTAWYLTWLYQLKTHVNLGLSL